MYGDCTGKVGAFHRRSLRTIVGLSRQVRNELVYLIAGQLPLQLLCAKAMWRYIQSTGEAPRLVSKMVRWVGTLED